MKILWLSVTSGLYKDKSTNTYNGGGWIASLQKLLMNEANLEMGVAFVSHTLNSHCIQDGVHYYPIYQPPISGLAKLKNYYGGYKTANRDMYASEILSVVRDFRPDIIHLFGMENPLASILGKTDIPVVVHLQGLLAPYDNAFFPTEFNKYDFVWPPSVREWIIRNGIIHLKNNIHIRGKHEKLLFKKVQYTMGRTEWDFQVSQLLAPHSHYFHVNEVMRDVFYENAGKWNVPKSDKFTIISTISETMYKGLDLILKASALLKENTHINFVWKIVGIRGKTNFVKRFERILNIKSNDVNIEYLGVLTAEEIVKLQLESNVYVHPSYIDNSPNSLCEAQLIGMPVIACNVGGVSTLLKNDSGILVPANAPYELVYHLRTLAEKSSLQETLSEKGKKEAASRHDKEETKKELLNAYHDILADV